MKLPKIKSVYVLPIILVILAMMITAVVCWPHSNPLDAYVIQRNCEFLEFAGLHAAACTDGTSWLVEPLTP